MEHDHVHDFQGSLWSTQGIILDTSGLKMKWLLSTTPWYKIWAKNLSLSDWNLKIKWLIHRILTWQSTWNFLCILDSFGTWLLGPITWNPKPLLKFPPITKLFHATRSFVWHHFWIIWITMHQDKPLCSQLLGHESSTTKTFQSCPKMWWFSFFIIILYHYSHLGPRTRHSPMLLKMAKQTSCLAYTNTCFFGQNRKEHLLPNLFMKNTPFLAHHIS